MRNRYITEECNKILNFWKLEEYFTPSDYPELTLTIKEGKQDIPFDAYYNAYSTRSLPLKECFPYIIFYSFGVFGLYPYETYKTLCITQGKPIILLLGSTIGAIIRVLVCYIFCNTSIALFIFGIANFIDFYSRSVIYRISLKKINKSLCVE